MVNYRIAYDRFIRAAKKKNIKDGLLDKTCFNDIEKEVHHIIPKVLGGSNKFENLVMLSHEDHIFAHMLLNLALIQEKKPELLNTLNYVIPIFDKLRTWFKTKHAFRDLKIDIYTHENKPPIVVNIDEATKYFCFMAHKNPQNELMFNGMFGTVVRVASMNGSKFGYKMKFHM